MTENQLTGEQLRRIEAAFESVPFVHLLGLELGVLEHGAATLHLNVRDELRQVRGLLHGGVTASLIDTAAAFAIITTLADGESTATVDLTVHYMRPLLSGRLTAEARVLRAGRRLLTVSVDVRDEAGNVAATALTTYAKLS
ncbi:MAG: hypothetical protein QOD00_606 [Blastocatellia bacterium]|nr:hypothetical protein [Blastocatellia bacterium]